MIPFRMLRKIYTFQYILMDSPNLVIFKSDVQRKLLPSVFLDMASLLCALVALPVKW